MLTCFPNPKLGISDKSVQFSVWGLLPKETSHKQLLSLSYLDKLNKGLGDEDERDEEGKDLLGKAWNKADQETAFKCHCDRHNYDEPKANPYTACQIVNAVCFAELWEHKNKETYVP